MASASALSSPAANVPGERLTAGPRRPAAPAALGSIVIAIAFLLGLTSARDADVWAHLASGRAVVSSNSGGNILPGCWLADLAMYVLYAAFGGAGLVLAKAGLVAATAAVMWGGTSLRAATGVFLAVLALGAWMPLSPDCVSYLFMALTVRGLSQGHEVRSRWWLLLVFVVWANVSLWCLLGLAFVALYAITRTVLGGIRGDSARASWRLLLGVVVATCLSLLPWHAPTVIGRIESQLKTPEAILSPFRKAAFDHLVGGRIEGEVPQLAFWLLTGVVAASLVVALRWETGEARRDVWLRVFPWLALFAAAAINPRFVPFSIVVSGTIAAVNLGSHGSFSSVVVRPWSRAERLRRAVQMALGVLATTLLLAAAWVGWFQPLPSERRNWAVEADPSLVRAAMVVDEWYASGRLAENQETVFLAEEAESAFQWFAPRVPLARLSISQVRSDLLMSDSKTAPSSGVGRLATSHVGCVVISDPHRAVFAAALRTLTGDSSRWKLAHLRGRAAIFVRQDVNLPTVDLQARAFSAKAADRAPTGDGSGFALAEHWYDPFVYSHPARSIDRDEAVTYLLFEEATRDRRRAIGANRFMANLIASVVGTAAPAPGRWPIDARAIILRDALKSVAGADGAATPFPYDRFASFHLLASGLGDAYLAVRAARRAVASTPRDASAYEALGDAYLRVLGNPLEESWKKSFPALQRLRLIQAAAAFRRATTLDDGRVAAHRGLALVHLESGFLDLALSEFQTAGRLAQSGHLSEEEGQMRALADAVQQARQTTQANAANMSVGDRARLAARNGLAGEALDLLLQSDVAVFGAAGLAQEFDLLLAAGRVTEARAWLSTEHKQSLGSLNYDWLSIQIAAAFGDYDGASAVLRSQIATLPSTSPLMPAEDFWKAVELAAKEVLNKRQNEARMGLALATSLLSQFASAGRQLLFERQTKTEAYLLLTLFALEAGDIAAANGYVESARQLWADVDAAGIAVPSPQRVVLRQMASLILP